MTERKGPGRPEMDKYARRTTKTYSISWDTLWRIKQASGKKGVSTGAILDQLARKLPPVSKKD